MILNRLGNKTKIANEIQKYFPRHDIYIEPFFGAGGMFFNKPKAKYNFLNDIDDDVYNLFIQVKENKDELVKILETVPITETAFKEWGKGKKEDDPIWKAIRFLIISNYGLYGKANTLRIGAVNPRKQILDTMDYTFNYLKDAYFFNTSFENVLKKCDYKSNIDRVFIYNDAPYLDTDDNYSNSFTEEDSYKLFNVMEASKAKWAMSEFDHPFILKQAEERGLNVHIIGERTNLMNKRTEILVTNYQNNQLSLF